MSAPRGGVGRENPTEDQPSSGYAHFVIAGEEFLLSDGCWWIDDDGEYVIRSSEFDVIAGGESFPHALAAFITNVLDYGVYLGELDELAENEEEMFHKLGPRLARVAQALSQMESRRRRQLIPRRRRERPEQWHPSSRHRGSRLPSPA